jgi:hypothetical protein
MLEKKFKLSILALVCITSINSFGEPSAIFKDHKWEFLEYKLISKPEAIAHKYSDALCASCLGALFCYGFAAIYDLTKDANDYDNDHKNKCRIGASFVFSFVASLIGGSILIDYYKGNQLLYKAIQQLVANWPKYQQYIPEELHETFNELYNAYGQNPNSLPKKKALKLVNIMREAVMNRAPEKYYIKCWNYQPAVQFTTQKQFTPIEWGSVTTKVFPK